jgi:hypothetical protein
MSDTVIQVENLGKMYRIRHGGQADRPRYTALRDVLADRARSVVRSLVVPWSRSPAAAARRLWSVVRSPVVRSPSSSGPVAPWPALPSSLFAQRVALCQRRDGIAFYPAGG